MVLARKKVLEGPRTAARRILADIEVDETTAIEMGRGIVDGREEGLKALGCRDDCWRKSREVVVASQNPFPLVFSLSLRR
jgi:hypothetical protein